MFEKNIHTHESKARLISRMARIVGHTNSIKSMIECNRGCSEILVQIAAVRSALNGVGKLLLDDHMNHCVIEAMQDDAPNKKQLLSELKDAIDKFVR